VAWLKVDDNAPHHKKMLAAGDVACWLWICGLAYCQRHMTDGLITPEAVPFLGCKGWKASVSRLVSAGLWVEDQNGYRVHDFLQWNDSASERAFKAENGRRRVELFRDANLRAVVKDRDLGLCRYCGVAVVWHDRRGPHGGTYDHIDPAISNEVDNLVVCCRSCNASKKRRTPEQAGMSLLPPGTRFRSDLSRGTGSVQVNLSPPLPQPTPQPIPTPPKNGGDVRGGSVVSPLEFEKLQRYNAFVGARLRVPHKLHSDFVAALGGDEPDAVLRRWYADVDAEIEQTKEGIAPDIWKWLEARFKQWLSARSGDAEMAKFLQGA
jgi:5-methylcytosine-specific restriction endonuclease McrA